MDCKTCQRKYQSDLEPLTPRILAACGHTMCQECLQKKLEKGKVVCPVDGTITDVNGGINDLVKNFALFEILEEQKTQGGKTSKIECKICLREYNFHLKKFTPRVLTKCGHTVCQACIRKQVQNRQVLCPFDRVVTVVSGGVKELAKNHSVLELVGDRLPRDSDSGDETSDVEETVAPSQQHVLPIPPNLFGFPREIPEIPEIWMEDNVFRNDQVEFGAIFRHIPIPEHRLPNQRPIPEYRQLIQRPIIERQNVIQPVADDFPDDFPDDIPDGDNELDIEEESSDDDDDYDYDDNDNQREVDIYWQERRNEEYVEEAAWLERNIELGDDEGDDDNENDSEDSCRDGSEEEEDDDASEEEENENRHRQEDSDDSENDDDDSDEGEHLTDNQQDLNDYEENDECSDEGSDGNRRESWNRDDSEDEKDNDPQEDSDDADENHVSPFLYNGSDSEEEDDESNDEEPSHGIYNQRDSDDQDGDSSVSNRHEPPGYQGDSDDPDDDNYVSNCFVPHGYKGDSNDDDNNSDQQQNYRDNQEDSDDPAHHDHDDYSYANNSYDPRGNQGDSDADDDDNFVSNRIMPYGYEGDSDDDEDDEDSDQEQDYGADSD